MMNARRLLALVVALLPAACARMPETAAELLDAAVTAHGGEAALAAGARMRVDVNGSDHWRTQSRSATPPWDVEPFRARLHLDLPARTLVWEVSSRYPGGFDNHGRSVVTPDGGRYVNRVQQVRVDQPTRRIEGERDALLRFPHVILLAAREQPDSVNLEGERTLSDGTVADVLHARTRFGEIRFAVDRETQRVRAVLDSFNDAIHGELERELLFSDEAEVDGVVMPGRAVLRVGGDLAQDVAYENVEIGAAIPDSLLAPSTFDAWDAGPALPVVFTLAPGVWMVRQGGAWSLAVSLDDHVAVIDAPPSGIEQVVARIDSLSGGKPIRFVVPTHHHDDHGGAVATYVARGATVITTPGNRAWFEQHIAARGNGTSPQIEVLADKRHVLGSGSRTVELHDIGPGPHAEEMIVAWLPQEGILFQADLLNLPANARILPGAANPTVLDFVQQIEQRGWNLRTLAGTHLVPVTMTELRAVAGMPLSRPAW